MRASAVVASVLFGCLTAFSVLAAQPPRLVIQRVPLAGYSFHAAQSVWARLREGDVLILVREAHNPYDALAVRVDWMLDGQPVTLGYLPRTANAAVAQALDAQRVLEASIGRLRASPDPRRRLELEISLRGVEKARKP